MLYKSPSKNKDPKRRDTESTLHNNYRQRKTSSTSKGNRMDTRNQIDMTNISKLVSSVEVEKDYSLLLDKTASDFVQPLPRIRKARSHCSTSIMDLPHFMPYILSH